MKYIFLHGLGQNSSSWDKVLNYINVEDYDDIICLNLFELLSSKEITYTNLYIAFCEYCRQYYEPINICGLSLGGIIALQYSIEYPSKVKSVTLIGTQYVMPKTLLKIQNAIFYIMPKSAFINSGVEKHDFIKLSKSMMDLNFKHDLNKIICPCLIICGKKDKPNKKATIELSQLLSNAEVKFINNSGHEVNIDAPEELGATLNDFFLRNKI